MNQTNRKLDLSSTGIGRKGEAEFAQLLENLKLRAQNVSRIQVLEDSEAGQQQSPTNLPDDNALQNSHDERKHDKKRKSSKRRVVQEEDDHSHNSHNSHNSANSTNDLHISKDNRCALEELILARNNIEGMRLINVCGQFGNLYEIDYNGIIRHWRQMKLSLHWVSLAIQCRKIHLICYYSKCFFFPPSHVIPLLTFFVVFFQQVIRWTQLIWAK